MRSWSVIAAVGVFLGVVVSWNLAMVAVLRAFRINLPLSLAFRFYQPKEPEVLETLSGRSINTYVVISGLLRFACPLFVGSTAYDYVFRHWIEHHTYGLKSALASVVWLLVLGIAGVCIGLRDWQKSAESGIGFAVLVILVWKVSTDTMGVRTAIVALISAALCSFVYFGIRRIRGAFRGTKRYPSRRGMKAETNFIAEPFVPTESYKAQQVDMAQKLVVAGFNPEPMASTFSLPVDPHAGKEPEDDKAKDP